MREATKLSVACRLFRDYYGRWPKDADEIEDITEGIRFDVFASVVVTPNPDDTETIEVFDASHVRAAVKAVPVDFRLTDADRAAARAPGFKIRL
jgi:hypothetical protein